MPELVELEIFNPVKFASAPVILVSVVLASVELPDTERFVIVRDEAISELNAPMPAVILSAVVDPKVVDPVFHKFVEKREVKPPIPEVRLRMVVDAKVDEPVTSSFAAT